MNRKSLGECTPISCPKAGIKIHPSNNDYRKEDQSVNEQINNFKPIKQSKLTKPVSFQNSTLSSLDLDLDNYSLNDLYHLFNIDDDYLSEESLKSAKQIVLKMHPDKSRLESKYFLFFSKAYKRLFNIYEFQNKSLNKQYKDEDFFDESNKNILNNMFEKNKDFKEPKNFNNWFNKAFEKHRTENPNEDGHGDWLKSDEGFISVNENITKGNMNEVFEQKKKQIQSMTVYTGVTDTFSSTFGGSLLDGGGDFSTDTYTDLRQAYTETLIPVTEEDYNKMQKFNNLSEYKAHRERVDVVPLNKEEAERKLHQLQQKHDQHSAALAFKYAKQSEKVKENQNGFWSDLKQITGW
jgi:hypothetical protein